MPVDNSFNAESAFSLYIRQNTKDAKIRMVMLREPLNTADLPQTVIILKKFLPNVLKTECFNDDGLPFHMEVKRTEVGHLFEHILLEYLCQLKIAKGFKSAVYAGRTRWNWERDPRGIFHIHINCPLRDGDILPAALNKTINLMNIILKKDLFFGYRSRSGNQLGMKNGKKSRRKLLKKITA